MKGLTPKQLQILQFIELFIQEHHFSPTYREIMEHFSYQSPGTVSKHLRILESKGAIQVEKGMHRSIKPTASSSLPVASSEIRLPLIGNLSTGYPLELFVDPKMIPIPSSLVNLPNSTYLLQTQGDSLHDEWILDGDLLIVEARQDIHPGEMILGLINQHDTVLKKYFPEGQHIRLESQNSHVRPLIIRPEHIVIQGVMIGLLRIH